MRTMNFWTPAEVQPRYDELTNMYSTAFAGEPWYEVSKCPDNLLRCAGGLSSLAVGAQCSVCWLSPQEPAYTAAENAERWDYLAETRKTSWYTEENSSGLTMAALAWEASVEQIAEEKYGQNPSMLPWLKSTLGCRNIIWLDEVFSDRSKKSVGNLDNFKAFCTGFQDLIGGDVLAFRTITPQMIRAAQRDFDEQARISEPYTEVPDRRTFVTIGSES